MKKISNNDFREKGLTEEEINSPEFDPDEFAPNHKTVFVIPTENKQPLLFVFLSALLALILIALGMFTSVDSVRSDARANAVLEQYNGFDSAELVKTVSDCDVYAVYLNAKLGGYGVYCATPSFGGNIEVLVCFGIDNKITKVKVTDHNESVGVGSKVTESGYLKIYKNLSKLDDISSVDGILISGATDSSNAVKNAVRTVFSLDLDIYKLASELKLKVATAEEIKNAGNPDYVTDTDKDESTEETDDKAETTKKHNSYIPDTGEIDRRELDGKDTDNNVNTGDGDVGADGKDVTTVYETEGDNEDTTGPADTTEEDTTVYEPPVTDPVDTTTAEPVVSDEPTDSVPVDSDSTEVDSDSTPVDSDTP